MSIQDEVTRALVEAAVKWWREEDKKKAEPELEERVIAYLKAKTRNSRRGKWSK